MLLPSRTNAFKGIFNLFEACEAEFLKIRGVPYNRHWRVHVLCFCFQLNQKVFKINSWKETRSKFLNFPFVFLKKLLLNRAFKNLKRLNAKPYWGVAWLNKFAFVLLHQPIVVSKSRINVTMKECIDKEKCENYFKFRENLQTERWEKTKRAMRKINI